MQERHEHVTRREPAVVREPAVESEHVDVVATDPYAHRRNAAYKARQAIYFIFGIIEGLIAIRFILRALGANPNAGFADFIYTVTAPFLAPFVGLFSTSQ